MGSGGKKKAHEKLYEAQICISPERSGYSGKDVIFTQPAIMCFNKCPHADLQKVMGEYLVFLFSYFVMQN